MQTCVACGATFEPYPLVNGVRLNLHGRQRCLACLPRRRLARPRKPVKRAVRMNVCAACGGEFPDRIVIDGVVRNVHNRRFCLSCSPFGAHNTSKTPPGSLDEEELREYRRKRRNAKTYRYQKKRRRQLKALLVAARGGRCVDCGFAGNVATLDFHHREPSTKEFVISRFAGSWTALMAEADKCDLVCANCHRLRHLAEEAAGSWNAVVEFRRRTKVKAVALMGRVCQGCGREGPPAIFDFHHLDASTKDFALGQDGIPRRWSKVLAELAKCVMLCANCHREVHAGVLQLDQSRPGLAETALPYAA